jgi:hypothetical protein
MPGRPPTQIGNRFEIEAHRRNPTVPIDFDAAYAPTTQTYHGFSIQIDGVQIGRITEWTPQAMDREMTHVFELNARTWGQPVDLVPGRATQFTLSFARAEVWGEEVEKAFGETDVYALLIDQNAPFQIDEVYSKGAGQIYRQYKYLGCWFNSKTFDAFSGEGNGIISIQGEITFVNKIKVK